MFSKTHFTLAAVLSTTVFLAATQSARSQQVKLVVTGAQLTKDDGPFLVYGYRDDLPEGVQLGGSFDSLDDATNEAARYISTNANRGGGATIWAYTQTPTKKQFLSLPKARKKDFKDEKKAEPIPDLKPKPFVGVKPDKPLDAAAARRAEVVGTWNGKGKFRGEAISATFVFRNDGKYTIIGNDGSWAEGTWVREGNSVILTLADGTRGRTYDMQGNKEMTTRDPVTSWTLKKY
jgi:hypothetical protein